MHLHTSYMNITEINYNLKARLTGKFDFVGCRQGSCERIFLIIEPINTP